MKTVLDHFYWVASAQDKPGSPAWHVQVFDTAETMAEVEAFGGEAKRGRVLTIEQAAAEGLDLSAIGAIINTATARAAEMAQVAAQIARAEVDPAKGAQAEAETRVAALESQLAAAAALAAERQAESDQLRADLASLNEKAAADLSKAAEQIAGLQAIIATATPAPAENETAPAGIGSPAA